MTSASGCCRPLQDQRHDPHDRRYRRPLVAERLFYCLDVETFLDGNGDGCGDFSGLTQRVDYLAGLGVTCLWLMPFQPSPNRDDGYDIVDYYAVDQHLGTLGQFVEFVRTARDRGLKVIADLVVNHTSRRAPLVPGGAADRHSPYRDFYVWRDEPPEEGPKDLVSPDEEDSNWEWDEEAGQYFLHRFYKHQPDLNFVHPAVREEIARIAGFWLQLGLSGFRVDAVPFLLETIGTRGRPELDPHKFLRDLRAFIGRRCGDAILLGEVNLEPEEQRRFFGDEDGDELHMCLNFNVNQAMALALVRAEAAPLVDALRALTPIPEDAQWGNFVRNHDERTLDRLLGCGAGGGVRRLRAGALDAAVRPGLAAPPAYDVRRRPGGHADGLQPHSRCRERPPVLRRGDRHGREPRHQRAAERPHPDAVVRRGEEGFSSAPRRCLAGRLYQPTITGPRRQRRRSAERPARC